MPLKPIVVAGLLAGVLGLATVAPAHAQPGDDSESLAQIMFARINEARRDSGLRPYTANPILTRIAFEHAREIAAHNHYSHTSLDGRKPKDRAIQAGYGAGFAGLRIGENFVGRQHLDDGFQWLMEDPPHRANMLHPDYREAGSGAARISYGYIWVIDFGMYNGIDRVLAGLVPTAPPPTAPGLEPTVEVTPTATTAPTPVPPTQAPPTAIPTSAPVTPTVLAPTAVMTEVLATTGPPTTEPPAYPGGTQSAGATGSGMAGATPAPTAAPPQPAAGSGGLPMPLILGLLIAAVIVVILLARRDLAQRSERSGRRKQN